ncbi:hypothetical protein HPL003_17550 [Paenibacillus terrae HPL-003]|uniref:Uncharacterized protein n=1 Tax=Paenibacillus terrae (strain HPL-003) TaxID=985665 RepID=G7VZG0_PAETH|nr:hypothetical protein HPL003_17550 [Paenibacillus terrae HPL-003]
MMKALLSRTVLLVPIGDGLFYILDCNFQIIDLINNGMKRLSLTKVCN